MSAKLIYRTRGGVLVTISSRRREMYRGKKLRWKGFAYRVDTGGRHGWIWMHLLEVAS